MSYVKLKLVQMSNINIFATLAQTINKTCLNLPLYILGWFLGGCNSLLAGFGWFQVSLTCFKWFCLV